MQFPEIQPFMQLSGPFWGDFRAYHILYRIVDLVRPGFPVNIVMHRHAAPWHKGARREGARFHYGQRLAFIWFDLDGFVKSLLSVIPDLIRNL